jgi:TM2 domain-containing membrane protein YozV
MPEVFCKSCGEKIKREAEICPKCGVRQFAAVEYRSSGGPSKNEALNMEWLVLVLLCFFLGEFGIHQFYSGKKSKGILMAVICGVGIILCFIYVGWAILIGLWIWALVDFVKILTEKFTNAEGKIY